MTCEHKRIKSVNCVFYCMDCGAKIEAPKQDEKKPSAGKPQRKTKKGATK